MTAKAKKQKSPTLRVKRSKAGLGLYALTEFKRGDFIVEYTGEHITDEEADKRSGKYLFILTKDLVIDGRGRSNIARYINHSCKPNAEAELDLDELKVRILARKKITAGEEITYDYGKEYWNHHIRPFGCRCQKCED